MTNPPLPNPILLETDLLPPGFVNPDCSFIVEGGKRFILLKGIVLFAYDLVDSASERMLLIQLHLQGSASLADIHRASGISLRSLFNWKKRFQQGGFNALVDQPIPGRNRKDTPSLIADVILLRARKLPHADICAKLALSGSALDRIIKSLKAKSPKSQALLDFTNPTQLTPENPAPPSLEPLAEPTAEPIAAPIAEPTAEPPAGPTADPEFDPRNRDLDRLMARLGLMEDATPIIAPGEHVQHAGYFLAIMLLGRGHPILSTFQSTYGQTLGPAFHGLRTVVMTLLMMALLRIKRIEELRDYEPRNLGHILGLDRIMEVKTLRRKLHTLARQNAGPTLMSALAQARLRSHEASRQLAAHQAAATAAHTPLIKPPGPSPRILYLDGHVQAYHGQEPIGQAWSATRNRTIKATTSIWGHLPGGQTLFFIESKFNDSLPSMIRAHLQEIALHLGGKDTILAFDRECWDTDFLNWLDTQGWKFITYRKGTYPPLPLGDFPLATTAIGPRTYQHAPLDHSQSYPHHEIIPETSPETSTEINNETTNLSQPKRRQAAPLTYREIRILSDDQSHQIAIVTNLPAPPPEQSLDRSEPRDPTTTATATVTATATEIAALLFARWGSQENIFKYLIEEFSLDALVEHNQGPASEASRSADETLDPSHHHPNPAHTKLTKTLQKQRQARAKELAKYGHTYQSQAHQSPAEQAILLRKLQQLESSPAGAKLRALNAQISQTEAARDALAERENTSQAGYKKLRSGIKQITTHIALCAYDLESELYRMLEGGYANWYKDGRAVVAAALKSRGKLSYEKGKLIIELEAQSSPVRTRAINSIVEQLNQTPSHYPGTDLEIELRPTPLPK